jgi:hypothetical protein
MRRLGLFGALALLVAMARCAYAPKFADDKLQCGPGQSCPAGYQCRRDLNTCWSTAPGAVVPSAENFPGHWVFTAGSTVTISCTDGSMSSKPLTDDFVDVAVGTTTDLSGSYYCDWDLVLNADKTATTIPAGQSCMTTDPAKGTVFTWHGIKFAFATSDGRTATLSAEVSSDYVDKGGVTGSCSIKISGTLKPL